MTYIDYLNRFNQWLESNALPASSQLMFYKLLYVFNRAGWPEYVGVDNLRLMLMIEAKSEKTAIRARDKLVEAGFISYKKGKKNSPNLYAICERHGKKHSVCDSVSDSICDSVSASVCDSHIKTKTKKNPPTPQGALSEPNGAPKSALSEADKTFAAFWGAYPRKDGKAAARKKWQSLAPDPALLAHMLQAIKTMSASEQWQADGGRYIPMASTWLNQRRWEDVPPPGKKRRAVEVMAGDFDPIKALTGELWRARTLPEE